MFHFTYLLPRLKNHFIGANTVIFIIKMLDCPLSTPGRDRTLLINLI